MDNGRIVLMVALVGLLTIVLAFRALADGEEPVTINAGDLGETFELHAGETLVIELVSNPTTGYRWQAVSGQPVVEQLGEARFTPESDRVGAGGVESLRFRAAVPGETQLELVYRRPWEEDVDPLEQFAVRVVVK